MKNSTNEIHNLPINFFERLEERKQFQPSLLRAERVFFRGKLSQYNPQLPTIAIVGSRKPTSYGIRFVHEFLSELRGLPWNIVSGGAFGIDHEVHKTALSFGLKTQAWVVGPIAKPSPQSHRTLFENIINTDGCGILVPECLEPSAGSGPVKSHWIQRNQWLVASCDALVVVEASIPSGTWSSAKAAATFGITNYLLPGSIFSPQSQGINEMISAGYGLPILSIDKLVKTLVVDFCASSYNIDKGALLRSLAASVPARHLAPQTGGTHEL